MTSVITRSLWHCLAVIGTLGWYSDAAAAAQSNLPLDQAARNGDIVVVRNLLQQGADPNGLNKWGTNALTGACSLGAGSADHTKIVELLLANGADVNRQVLGGTTALNEAAYWGHIATVKVLLDAGADVNATKENGYTPLLAAASRGHLEIVSELLDAGANIDARTRNGLTALHLASAGGFPDVVGLLEQAGADTTARSAANETHENVAGRTAELQREIAQLEREPSATPVAPDVGQGRDRGVHDLTWWELLASFVVTWAIGLAPPLLIRYGLVRGPMSRGAAVATAALFYFGNIVLFTMLGSTNRSHAVLFLIAWLSYWILQRPMRESELRAEVPCPIEAKGEGNGSVAADSLDPGQPGSPVCSTMRGWARLGVVLSIVWLLGVLAYTMHDYWSLQSAVSSTAAGHRSDAGFDEWEIVSTHSALSICNHQTVPPKCSLRVANVFTLALGPIVAIWMLTFSTVVAIRWVRAGFRGSR